MNQNRYATLSSGGNTAPSDTHIGKTSIAASSQNFQTPKIGFTNMDGDLAFQYAKKERPRALPLFRFRLFADDQGVGFSAFVQDVLQAAALEFFVLSEEIVHG